MKCIHNEIVKFHEIQLHFVFKIQMAFDLAWKLSMTFLLTLFNAKKWNKLQFRIYLCIY